MKQSQLFTKTQKEAPKDEVSKNAQLLIRAGYVHKELAGVYSFLPLGWRMFNKITDVVKDELEKVNSVEMFMSSLQSKDKWEKTDRWSDDVVDNWFKTKLKNDTELGLAFTHEEVITNIMTNFVSSYKDLPFSAYHIQNKFRNEVRAKSGVMRGREFFMKDSYSFSKSVEEHEAYYEEMRECYTRIFNRLGIGDKTFVTVSSGGSFSKYSYEFQTITDAGEDTIYIDDEKGIAINADDWNDETVAEFGFNPDKSKLREEKAAEVGDIYSLGTKYAEALGLKFTDKDGKDKPVVMGSYGLGINRVLGVLAEIFSDEHGLALPEEVAPFKLHLISINADEQADALYQTLQEKGVEVLFDDRDTKPGQKLGDAELIGIPHRIVISPKTIDAGGVEYKKRTDSEANIISIQELLDLA